MLRNSLNNISSDKYRKMVEKNVQDEEARTKKLTEEVLTILRARASDPVIVTKIMALPREAISQILTSMICLSCNRVPSPYKRFLCPDGHLFCGNCGEDRYLKHAAKCLVEIRGEEDQLSKKSYDGETPAVLPLPSVGFNTDHWSVLCQTSHFPLCQKKVELYPADPIYTATWLSTTWKCPLKNRTCNALVKGFELFTHMTECSGAEHPVSTSEETPLVETSPPSIVSRRCAVNGCESEVPTSEMVEHLTVLHGIYAMDLRDFNTQDRLWRRGARGLLYIPQSCIEERKSHYTVIRYNHRFFLFCMEPSTANSFDMGFWIRPVNKEGCQEEEDDRSFSTYDLFIINKYTALKMTYMNNCIPWLQPAGTVFEEAQCLTLPTSMLLDQLVISCDEGTDNSSPTEGDEDENGEKGYLPVKFKIFVGDAVGDLYCNNDEGGQRNGASPVDSPINKSGNHETTDSVKKTLPSDLDTGTESDCFTDEEVDQDDDTAHKSLWQRWPYINAAANSVAGSGNTDVSNRSELHNSTPESTRDCDNDELQIDQIDRGNKGASCLEDAGEKESSSEATNESEPETDSSSGSDSENDDDDAPLLNWKPNELPKMPLYCGSPSTPPTCPYDFLN